MIAFHLISLRMLPRDRQPGLAFGRPGAAECEPWALWVGETDLPSINGPGRLLGPQETGSRTGPGGGGGERKG